MPAAVRLFFFASLLSSFFLLVELSALALDFFSFSSLIHLIYISSNIEICQNYWTGMTSYIEQKEKKSFMPINSI